MELEEVSLPEIPPGYSRRIFTKRDKAIIEDIKNFQPCTLFKETYIQYALSAFKRGIVYYHGSTLQGLQQVLLLSTPLLPMMTIHHNTCRAPTLEPAELDTCLF